MSKVTKLLIPLLAFSTPLAAGLATPAFANVVCTGDWNGAGSSTITWGDKGLVHYTFNDMEYPATVRNGLTLEVRTLLLPSTRSQELQAPP